MASEYLKWKYRDVVPDQSRELTPAEKRANWWHYHKWHILLVVVLAAAAVNILGHALGFWQVRPDYQVAYVGSSALLEDTATALETALAQLGRDCNGDGRVIVRLNQYTAPGSGDSDAALYAYADSARLMADLDSCDSYFFLLEDPETFQKNYQVLCRLDGSLPQDGDWDYESCCLLWSDCPILRDLPLGEYSQALLGQELSGDSQELLAGLFLARRGFWSKKSAPYSDACDELWAAITEEALW